MTVVARLVLVGLVRTPARTALRCAALASAVGLLAAMVLFVGHSLGTMTSSAVKSVPLDWQGPVASYRAATGVADDVSRQAGVAEAAASATAPFLGAEHASRATGTIRAGAGAILAVPTSYLARIKTFRFLRGGFHAGSVVLDQQLAATLQAQIGDMVTFTPRRGARAVRLPVSGVAIVAAADQLFQPLNPLIGPAPAQPPSNIAIVPVGTFAARIAPRLPSITAAVGASAVPGAQTGTQWQVQVQVAPSTLSGNPAHALQAATQLRNRVERSLPGRVVFVDNLSDALTNAAGDALYAETLYIMLAIPGAIAALGLAYFAALGTAERDRRTLALLRARGARRRDLVWLSAFESLVLGILASGVGTALAYGGLHLAGDGSGIGMNRLLVTFAVCAAFAAVGATAVRLATGRGAFRTSISEARRTIRRDTPALWERLYLDLFALAVAGLIFWLTERTGFSAVVNPDSNPTLSLSAYMFLAPALMWIGATLLLVRIRGGVVTWLARRLAGGRATTTRGFLLMSAGRRGAAINRGLIVLGLLLAFAVDLAIFTATYDQQARVDAQLTLGADVVVTAPGVGLARNSLASRVSRVSGVRNVSGVDHTYAYVGPDLQDTFGIDPATLRPATSLRDSYFLGGTASEMLHRLRARRDGVLVSKETITDYSLHMGDLLRLRVLDRASGRFRVVPFHVLGVVQEFPSAPKDSFMVANVGYLRSVTHDAGPNVFFVRTNGDPSGVARRIAAATAPLGATVKSIDQQNAQTASSITSVDLGGISRLEEAFVLVLSAGAIALFVAVSLGERQHELATMAALGASLRRAAAFVWSEALLVLAAALALAALLGWLLAEMLAAMLRHVFDPPPDHLGIPWGYLGVLSVAVSGGCLAATLLAAIRIRRLPLGAILREE